MARTVKKCPSVLVLVATFNGEEHLQEQLDSILVQKDVNVNILISDDGSTDSTYKICEEYAASFPNIIFRKNHENLGVARNYYNMICYAAVTDYDYFAFADQDDFWLPEKLAHGIEAIEEYADSPALYFSDVYNVDEDLGNPRHENEIFGRSDYAYNLKTTLISNCACGCTMVFNRSLCQLVSLYNPPSFPRIHDSWVYLIAQSCGVVVSDLNHSFILRRIGSHNVVGERKRGKISISRITSMVRNAFKASDGDYCNSAKLLLEGYSSMMDEVAFATIEAFVSAHDNYKTRLFLAMDTSYRVPNRLENIIVHLKIASGKI